MKNILLLALILLPLQSFALEVKVGDILLQPLDCWSCTLIEEQEESIYSHMGIVVATEPEIIVAQSLGTVHKLPFSTWNQKTEKGQKVAVYRFQNEKAVQYIEDNKAKFLAYFQNSFEGLKYDHDFLWNNFDENGDEKMYCSEMVTKFLKGFLRIELPVKRMKFDKNREEWMKYFRGNPPDGQWGNSPADFEKSYKFYEVGEL